MIGRLWYVLRGITFFLLAIVVFPIGGLLTVEWILLGTTRAADKAGDLTEWLLDRALT